jgi:tRNA(Ile)-lysidine synthase
VWLGRRGIAHHSLPWAGDKPAAGIQNAAREARYRLLAEACADRGILHLAVGHHRDDQAETVLFRQARGSGAVGLAGMPASRSLGSARLIRPLLGWSKADLVAVCGAAGQSVFDDPANRSPGSTRGALRRRVAADLDLACDALARAADMGQARRAAQPRLWRILAQSVSIRPDGAALIDGAMFRALLPEDRSAVLAAALAAIGGRAFAPAQDAVSQLDRRLVDPEFRGASLAGCVLRPWRGQIAVCRELRGIEPAAQLVPGRWRFWDRRFRVKLAAGGGGFNVGALGHAGFARLRRLRDLDVPAVLGAGLPAIREGQLLVSVPALGWAAEGAPSVELRFTPNWPLSSEPFTVVNRDRGIIFAIGA